MFILWLLEISFVFSESPFEAAKGLSPVKTLFTSFLVYGLFSDENELNSHIKIIEDEIKITDKNSRMKELKNWLDLIS